MKFLAFSQTKLGSSLSLPAHGWVGARATLLFLAAHFAKRNSKFGGGGKRWRAKIPSHQPPSFLPARAFRFCAPIKRKRNFCGLCPPSGGEPLGRVSARQGRNSCSKWVHTSFSNCDKFISYIIYKKYYLKKVFLIK